MMVEKESGTFRGADFPSVWTEENIGGTGTVRFLNNVTGYRVYRKPKVCLGGLIADDMGLGKTLTALALIAGSVTRQNNENQTAIRAITLVVAPLSTLAGWQDQIERHLKAGALRFIVYHGSQRQKNAALLSNFDVVLTTYETVRAEYSQALGGTQGAIQAVSWNRIILDEAHVIQNRSSKRFQAIHALAARHRWCLTGTPIQNRLKDLGSLVEFLRVDPFDSPGAFRHLFLDPISRQDASGWERLLALIRCISLRRTKDALENELALPARQEIVWKVSLDEEERRVYSLVKRRFALAINAGGNRMSAFQLILRLRQICDHGVALLPAHLQEWIQQASRFGPQVPLQAETCLSCGRIPEDDLDDDILLESLSCSHQVCRSCRLAAKSIRQDSVGEACCPVCQSEGLRGRHEKEIPPEGGDLPPYRPSSKVRELLRNLNHDQQHAAATGVPAEKSVIFSI
ncbi:SNF2 family N-terminal domain-containing protein [Chaetomium sp. MPI-CAGE-AT-0009]|nr:SNF2 family N-terminal domain-containing protein [Chaetomium sp. MPI-CAGE-AT-0009]